MTRAWVFDLDGTRYLERDYVRSGFWAVDRWARSRLEVAGVFDAAWRQFLTVGRGTPITDAFNAVGTPLTPDETTTVVNVYHRHASEIQMSPVESLAAFAHHLGRDDHL